MKVTMELTLDGLVRALRSQAFQMADDLEHGYPDRAAPGAAAGRSRDGLRERGEVRDDRGRD